MVGEKPGTCSGIGTYSGIVYDPNYHRMMTFGGGHAGPSYDGLNTFDLRTLKWVEEYLPTTCDTHVESNYDRTTGTWMTGPPGRPYPIPAARHTEDMLAVVGDEFIMLGKVEGNGGGCANTPGGFDYYFFATPARISHYNVHTKRWSFGPEGFSSWPGTAFDPVSGKIIALGQLGLESYDPVTRIKANHVNFGTYAGIAAIVDEQGNRVTTRDPMGYNNSLVYFPGDQKFYYFEHFSGKVWRVDLNRSDFSQSRIVRLDSVTGTPPSTRYEIGFAYDSKNQVMVGGPINNVMYVFHPTTKSWTSQVVKGGTPGTINTQNIAYDPVGNVFIFMTDY